MCFNTLRAARKQCIPQSSTGKGLWGCQIALPALLGSLAWEAVLAAALRVYLGPRKCRSDCLCHHGATKGRNLVIDQATRRLSHLQRLDLDSGDQAYMSSYSSSSSAMAGLGISFFFGFKSTRSSGQVVFSFNHGRIQSMSKR